MKLTIVPDNMKYIFAGADYLLSQEDIDFLVQKVARAKKLEKCNGAVYPGLTQSAVHWLLTAFHNAEPVSKDAFQKILDDLYQVRQPSKWY